jgi:hypothetical protein
MGGILLDVVPSEPLAHVKKLPYFNNSKEIHILLKGAPQFGVHDPFDCSLINTSRLISRMEK